jgi:protein-tyrosine kinase
MDRIRKALDLARLERAKPALEDNQGEEPTPTHGAVAAPLAAIVYTHTRVFTPSPSVLEANRVMNPGTADPGAVAFRMLRTQVLQRMDANNWRSLAIFSPADRDGKTTTAINLAVSLASDRRHTVLLVDFDFKRPSVAMRLGLSPQSGADDVLVGEASVQESLYHPYGFERLIVLPARTSRMNSSEILAGPRSREIVSELRNRYPERIIIFDLPPVLHADDALAFAPLVECGLVVASEGRTRRNDLMRTIELLHKTPLVGTVLNCATDAPRGY